MDIDTAIRTTRLRDMTVDGVSDGHIDRDGDNVAVEAWHADRRAVRAEHWNGNGSLGRRMRLNFFCVASTNRMAREAATCHSVKLREPDGDEYAAEWDDIVSGRDMHNTCLACGTDAHNNATCSDCTPYPRHCAVRGCDGVAVEGDTYCRQCSEEEDALVEMAERKLATREARLKRRGLTWVDLALFGLFLSFVAALGVTVGYGLAIRWGWVR